MRVLVRALVFVRGEGGRAGLLGWDGGGGVHGERSSLYVVCVAPFLGPYYEWWPL